MFEIFLSNDLTLDHLHYILHVRGMCGYKGVVQPNIFSGNELFFVTLTKYKYNILGQVLILFNHSVWNKVKTSQVLASVVPAGFRFSWNERTIKYLTTGFYYFKYLYFRILKWFDSSQ